MLRARADYEKIDCWVEDDAGTWTHHIGAAATGQPGSQQWRLYSVTAPEFIDDPRHKRYEYQPEVVRQPRALAQVTSRCLRLLATLIDNDKGETT